MFCAIISSVNPVVWSSICLLVWSIIHVLCVSSVVYRCVVCIYVCDTLVWCGIILCCVALCCVEVRCFFYCGWCVLIWYVRCAIFLSWLCFFVILCRACCVVLYVWLCFDSFYLSCIASLFYGLCWSALFRCAFSNIYMLLLFWRVVFVFVGLRYLVSLCVVWFRAVWICYVSFNCLFLVSLSLHRVVSCCVVSHRFGSFWFVLCCCPCICISPFAWAQICFSVRSPWVQLVAPVKMLL